MVRKAEGAEKPLEESDYLPTIRGGQKVKYFLNYPNKSGAWISKEGEK